MNQIPNIEEVDNTIKIGYDPASPDGDKSRVVLRFPDGQLKAFIPEDEYHHQLQKAREEERRQTLKDVNDYLILNYKMTVEEVDELLLTLQ